MEMQQKEKESLTTYIHHFKTETKGCDFTNNAVTIRIFVNGLKNVHSLATQIYEEGPQMLADAISEVEKLQASQQLTATLIPFSTVNVMSHEEDQCFQCQESGHITCHCPIVQCFKCDEHSHIVMDCPHRIPPSGTPACHHRPKSCSGHHTRSNSHHCHKDRWYRCIHFRFQSLLKDITAKVIMTPTEAIPGHITGITDDITGVVHNAYTQALIHIILNVTLHIANHLHTGALQPTPEITADHALNQPTNPPRKPCTNCHHIPGDHKVKPIPKGIQELQ